MVGRGEHSRLERHSLRIFPKGSKSSSSQYLYSIPFAYLSQSHRELRRQKELSSMGHFCGHCESSALPHAPEGHELRDPGIMAHRLRFLLVSQIQIGPCW